MTGSDGVVVAGAVVVEDGAGEVVVTGIEVGWFDMFFKETTLPLLLLGCPVLTEGDCAWVGVGFTIVVVVGVETVV